jgi:N-acetylmuramic acid 6-phosphate (MurNAc-6-P) etherase
MVEVNPANEKLRDRAIRIVQELTRKDHRAALRALERRGWSIKKAAAWLLRK